MRLVLDTNVAVSALLWQGVPRKLLEAAQAGSAVLVASVPLLDELRGVLERDKFARQLAARQVLIEDLLDGYFGLVVVVAQAQLSVTVQQDPSDVMVLSAAVGGRADVIVSGDADLLNLKQ